MKRRSTNQFELPTCGLGGVFNLSSETGADPFRLERERAKAEALAREAREYQTKMQLSLEKCPGFIGCDAPDNDRARGRVVVEPGRIVDAMPWLKRRFHVSESLDLSLDNGLCVEIIPRVRNSSCANGKQRVRVTFERPEQFELRLNTESEIKTNQPK